MSGTVSMRSLLNVVVVFALIAVAPAAAKAQSFGFSVSSGGGHHHHHHHGGTRWSFGYGYSPWWGPGWYGPPAVVYAPPPVVQERVIVVQPSAPPAQLVPTPYSSTAPSTSGSLAANTVPKIPASVADDRIVIRNTAGAKLPVTFVVDGQEVELTDGATRTFVGKTSRTIQYDRGGNYGSTQQDLAAGQYEFRITASGWDLARRPDRTPVSRTAVRANSLPDSVER